MDTSDSFFYENPSAFQSSINSSNNKQMDSWSTAANSSTLAVLYGRRANSELQFYANKSWDISSLFNESDLNFNDTNNTIPWFRGTIDLTTNLNTSSDDDLEWWRAWYRTPYPSGYSQLAIVVLAFFITCIMILIVVGNMLVCIAISTEKSLKPVQNWFIASLAVSDFLLGLVIMPFSLARELMGYWMFGQVWCDIHAALDVLLCTASINNLFMISLDRYWSITQAVKYLKKRTPSRAALMIAFVWILSAVVSLPPLVGWKKPHAKNDIYPECGVSDDIGYVLYSSIGSFYFPALMMVFVYARIFHAARSRARRHIQHKRGLHVQTEVTNDPAKEKSTTTTTTCTSLSNPSPPDLIDQNNQGGDDGVAKGCKPHTPESSPVPISLQLGTTVHQQQHHHQIGSIVQRTVVSVASPTAVSPPQIVVEAIAESHQSPTKDIAIISNNYDSTPALVTTTTTTTTTLVATDNNRTAINDTSDVHFKCLKQQQQTKCTPVDRHHNKRTPPKLTIILPETNIPSSKGGSIVLTKQNGSANTRTTETRFISNDDDSDTIESPLSRDHTLPTTRESKTFLSAPKLKSSYGSTMSIADYDESDICIDNDVENSDDNVTVKPSSKRCAGSKAGSKGVQYRTPPVSGIRSTQSDAERHKRKIAKARERRATLILGLIMAAFITAWLPFFVLYVLVALCEPCKDYIPGGYFSFAFWLGYCNSAANPIIYTIFNRDFRRAFRKILFK